VSGDEGAFRFEPQVERRYLWWIPLVPLDVFALPWHLGVESQGLRLCGDAPNVSGGVGFFLGDGGITEPQELGAIALCPAS
jgi:hypothetical protein